jgi:hypothetical protein
MVIGFIIASYNGTGAKGQGTYSHRAVLERWDSRQAWLQLQLCNIV